MLSDASKILIGTVREDEVVGVMLNEEMTGSILSGTLIVICRLTGREILPDESLAQAYRVFEPFRVVDRNA
jgi:hypothetical protein